MANTPNNSKDPLLLPAGDLRHIITIMQSTITTDASGSVQTWTPFLEGVRAKIEPLRGIELVRSGQDVTNIFVTITMRFAPGITSAMQVHAMGNTFIIQTPENVLGRNRILKLLCLGISTK